MPPVILAAMVAPSEIAHRVVEMFRQAAEANLATPAREGNVVFLSAAQADDVMIAGDLHGHRLNFHRLRRIADMASHPRRHLVLQEVCHGGPTYPSHHGCMSHLLLEDMAALKVRYPERFHFLMSNHEMAEVNDHLIAKGGRMLNMQFRAGLLEMYGEEADQVRDALVAFLSTCPLAVRMENGVFICHSIPQFVDERGFDAEIFSRALAPEDLQPEGAAFCLVWGRDFRPENAEAFARQIGADVLIHGHEPSAEGFSIPNDRQIILDCTGSRAAYVILPTDEKLRHSDVVRRIQALHAPNRSEAGR